MKPLLTVEQLAQYIHKSVNSIRSDACRNPQSLPPICRLPNTKRLLWRIEDVEVWLAGHVAIQVADATATPTRTTRRGRPTKAETVARQRQVAWQAGLIDLMRAYARLRTRDEFRPYAFDRRDVLSMEQALDRVRGLIGYAGDWTELADFLPEGWEGDPQRRRSATAATLAATLDLARQGRLEIAQAGSFAPITIRRRPQ